MSTRGLRTAPAIAGLLLGALGAALAAAQAPFELDPALPVEESEAPPVYEVEFLIFAYNELNPYEERFEPERPRWSKELSGMTLRATPETLRPGSADWYVGNVLLPPDPALDPNVPLVGRGPGAGAGYSSIAPTPPALVPLVDEFGNTIGYASRGADGRRSYRRLDASELQLGRALERLTTVDAYTPLAHAGWSQPTLFEDEAQAFELARLGKLQPAGSIRLHRSRFLHLTVDVTLQSDYRYYQAPLAIDDPWPLAEFVGPVRYHIQVQRRVRGGELHFFDHPAFGVLISVRPAPEAPDDGVTGARPAA